MYEDGRNNKLRQDLDGKLGVCKDVVRISTLEPLYWCYGNGRNCFICY